MPFKAVYGVLGAKRGFSSFPRFLRTLRQGRLTEAAILALLPPMTGGQPELVDTSFVFLTGLAGYDSQGRALPKPFTTAGNPPAGSPLPSVNGWGGNKYTVYFDWNPGTGASLGTCACQVETADGIGADASLRWAALGGAFTQALSNTNQAAVAQFPSPLVKVRLNVTNLVQSTNGDAALTTRMVVGS